MPIRQHRRVDQSNRLAMPTVRSDAGTRPEAWRNVLRSKARISRWVLVLSVVVAALSTPGVRGAEHDFTTTLVYRVLSVEQVNGQSVIEAEGSGVSRLLGPIVANASVTQSAVPNPCYSYSADFLLSAAAGTIQIHSNGMVCSPPTQITGTWSVTGGTGAFLGATGYGTEEGKLSFTGHDPVIDRLEGTLSYQDPGGAGTPLSAAECMALNDQYFQAYLEAKVCNPLAEHVAQCTTAVTYDLICGCPSYVNTRQRRALRIMDAARQAFTDAGCSGYWDCAAGFCPGVYGAPCVGEGPRGLCVDQSGW